jgi:RHS repeat-associated protein
VPKSATGPGSVSPPAGTGSVGGLGEAFSLDLNSGQSTFSVPFDLPDGVAGLKPTVKLEYAHSQSNGPFGLGWRLPLRQIDRRLDYGVPSEDGGDAEVFLDSGTELRRMADGRFHPLRETTFSRYERVGDLWQITERDGSRYLLGITAAARVADPDHPDRIQSWLLERQEDVHGNALEFDYETHDGFPYLSEIRYARFRVRLTYEARPDVVRNGRAGFVRLITRRCRSISLHLATDDREARRLALGYTNAMASGVSQLTTLQLLAFAPDQPDVTKNPVRLGYAPFEPRAQVAWVEAAAGDPEPAPLSDPDTTLIALDDLPLPGVLENRSGRLHYWPNDGRGGWGRARPLTGTPQAASFAGDGVQFLDVDGTGDADMLVGVGLSPLQGFYPNAGRDGFGEFVAYPRGAPHRPPFELGRARLADIDGDGIVDAALSTSRGLVTYRNRGRAGWQEPVANPRARDIDLGDPTTFFADMTGDGLPDVVHVRSGDVRYRMNLGHGRFSDPIPMGDSPRLARRPGAGEQVLLADVDGDGCTDLIRLLPDRIEVYINRSGQGFAPPLVVDVIPPPLAGTAVIADLDGSGSTGLLYNSVRAGRTGYVRASWRRAAPAYGLVSVDNGNGLLSEFRYSTVAEMGLRDADDGRRWTTRMPFPVWLVESTVERDVVRGRSSEVRYRYHDGHYDSRFRRFQGFRQVDKTEIGDASRADVLKRHTFLVDQANGRSPEFGHLDRLLATVEVFSRDGTADEARPLRTEETQYGLKQLEALPSGEQRVFVFAAVTRKRHTDRTGDERMEERSFAYDDDGNLVGETVRGRGTRGGTAMPEKVVDTAVDYARDAAGQIFKMARTTKRNAAGDIILELRRFYDGPGDAGLPMGQLERGRLVREEHLVLDRASFDAHYAGMDPAELGYVFAADAAGGAAVFAVDKRTTYTAQGNVATETSGIGRTNERRYDADNLCIVEEVTNGKTSRRVNDPVSGKPVSLVAFNGATVRLAYDAFGRLTQFMQADDTPDTATREIAYDDTAVPNAIRTSYRISPTRRAQSVTYYDGSAHEVQRRVQRDPGDVLVSPWLAHNPWRQTSQEFEPTGAATLDFAVPDLGGPSRRTFFDGDGRPVRTVNFNAAESRGEYRPFEIRLFDAYDLDPTHPHRDTPRREEVDVWNHRTAVTEDAGAGRELTTRYDVGLFGEVLAVRDDGGTVVTYGYDRRGNRLTVDHRDAGRREQWFNSQGEIVRMRDAAGNDITVERDGEGRITTVRRGGAEVEAFTYDDTEPGADGRLVEATYANGRQGFRYSRRGFLVQHDIDVAGRAFRLMYEADDLGKQTALTYPDGTRVTRSHYENGLVRRIDGVIDDVTYDARNLPIRIAFANGVVTEIDYEPGVGHVSRQRTVNAAGMVIEDAAYAHDAMSQLLSLDDSTPGRIRHVDYEYDGLLQLARVAGDDPAGQFDLAYQYAGRSNLVRNGESGWLLGYDDPARPDRLTSATLPGEAAAPVEHDANGNLTRMPGQTLGFDFKNHLSQAALADGTVIQYDYDYRGNRIRRRHTKNGVTTETIYIGRLVEFRGGQHTNFVVLDRRRIAMKQGGMTRWIHNDPLGSANHFSDEAGTPIARIAYHPFGTERSRDGAPVIRLFASHDVDEISGLVYMGHRWYAPQLGRFLTPDPLYLLEPEKSEGDPARLHLYTYAGNDPASRVDPDGLSFWSVVGAIVGVVVGIVVAVAIVAAFATGIGFGLLAIAGLIALVSVSYVVAHDNAGTGVGEFFRGFMIGLNAGLNAAFLTMMGPVGAFLGVFVGTLIFLSAFDTIANNEVYQGILGWSNWLMPMSWLVLGLGAVMWILNGLGHLIFWEIPQLWGGGVQFFRITGFRMDWSTGMLATRGGWVANLNTIDTAYNMGAFAFVDSASSGWHLQHEAGHNLNLGAFGSIFHFVGFIHEMGTPAGSGALSEQMAESNDPVGSGSTVPMWA